MLGAVRRVSRRVRKRSSTHAHTFILLEQRKCSVPTDAPRGTPSRRRSRDRDLLRSADWQLIDRELGLSAREHDIVELVLADVKESAMGARLGISPHTVHTHLERLYRKLGVRGRVQLVVRALGACLAHLRRSSAHAATSQSGDLDAEVVSPEQVTRAPE